jgi:hypothetical protein
MMSRVFVSMSSPYISPDEHCGPAGIVSSPNAGISDGLLILCTSLASDEEDVCSLLDTSDRSYWRRSSRADDLVESRPRSTRWAAAFEPSQTDFKKSTRSRWRPFSRDRCALQRFAPDSGLGIWGRVSLARYRGDVRYASVRSESNRHRCMNGRKRSCLTHTKHRVRKSRHERLCC